MAMLGVVDFSSLSSLSGSFRRRGYPTPAARRFGRRIRGENSATLGLIAVMFIGCELGDHAGALQHTIQISGGQYQGRVADSTSGAAVFVGEDGRYSGPSASPTVRMSTVGCRPRAMLYGVRRRVLRSKGGRLRRF